MNGVKERLAAIEKKQKRFKQQQFIFTYALERSQEQAHGQTEAVKTISQVQKYMIHHCSNATDRSIFLFFLEIVSDLNSALKLIKASCPNSACDALAVCEILLGSDSDISKLRAQYPHDEILRLSCETRHHYGGVVSFVPLALDLLRSAATPDGTPAPSPARTPAPAPAPTPPPTPTHAPSRRSSAEVRQAPPCSACSHATSCVKAAGGRRVQSARASQNPKSTYTGERLAGKPAWRPPGSTRK